MSSAGIFCTLFGLSIDYQVFLITRTREGWERTDSTPRPAPAALVP